MMVPHKCHGTDNPAKPLGNTIRPCGRRVAGVLEGVFVLKMKAKCGPSTKTQVFHTFHYKARTE